MGLNRKETTHVNRSSRTPAGIRWKHEHLRLIWTLIPRSFVIVLLLMVLSVGVAFAQTTKQPVAKKTAVTKQPAIVIPKGKPDKKYVRKVITGVTVYAYAPSNTRKGKKKKSKGTIDRYTSTGAIATAGRTIAVDPKQIPLGWWVYVEGMGYRKAEDVGGSIKGKKIDVFVNTYQDAIQFGVKKNRTIHVIGPNLPKVAVIVKPKSTVKPVATPKATAIPAAVMKESTANPVETPKPIAVVTGSAGIPVETPKPIAIVTDAVVIPVETMKPAAISVVLPETDVDPASRPEAAANPAESMQAG
jgi:3D (Asp-Asp-Asp) domain-containing protein